MSVPGINDHLKQQLERLCAEEDRLWSKVTRDTELGCLMWGGAHYVSGYGAVRHDGRSRPVHRVIWEDERGPVKPGHVITHTCGRKDCFEFTHLEEITHRELIWRTNPTFAAKMRPIEERWYDAFQVSEETGCFDWLQEMRQAQGGRYAYPMFYPEGNRGVRATHFSYERQHGEGSIGADWEIVQTCGNRRCVNPDHLDLTRRNAKFKEAGIPTRIQPGQRRRELSPEERAEIGERVRADRAAKKARGEYVGSIAPLGYRLEAGRLIEEPAEMETVRRICELQNAGHSPKAIATILQEEGRPTKRGGKWAQNTVRLVLARLAETSKGASP